MAVLFIAICAAGRVMADDQGVATAGQAPVLHSSGLPLPRFASLKVDKVYVRTGPGTEYPFAWVYKREGLPVEITQEYDQWRKIRDADGSTGWINVILLSGRRSALIRGKDPVDMRESPDAQARITAQLEPGVIADLRKCSDKYCQIGAGGYTGWVARNSLWGIYASEELN